MSSSSTPNLQVLNNFGEEMRAYSLQNETGEYNPITFIGPLSHINIFVGATNSGKSRFLRALAKSKEFKFFPDEMFNQMLQMKSCASYMATQQGNVTLHIDQSGDSRRGQPIAFSIANPRVVA